MVGGLTRQPWCRLHSPFNGKQSSPAFHLKVPLGTQGIVWFPEKRAAHKEEMVSVSQDQLYGSIS